MFKNYEEIPANYRRIILQETGYKRVKQVPLELCAEVISDHLQYEQDMKELMDFELIVQSQGNEVTEVFKTSKDAFVALDRAMDYDIRNPNVNAVIRQAGRIVRAVINGKVFEGKPRGQVEVKPMPKERYDTHALFYGGARCD